MKDKDSEKKEHCESKGLEICSFEHICEMIFVRSALWMIGLV